MPRPAGRAAARAGASRRHRATSRAPALRSSAHPYASLYAAPSPACPRGDAARAPAGSCARARRRARRCQNPGDASSTISTSASGTARRTRPTMSRIARRSLYVRDDATVASRARSDTCFSLRRAPEPAHAVGPRRLASITRCSCSSAQSRSVERITSGGASRIVCPVRVFSEQPAGEQHLADVPAGPEPRIDVDAGPQPGDAHRGDPVPDERLDALRSRVPSSCARFCRVPAASSAYLPIAAWRVAAERRAVLPGLDHPSTSASPTTAERGTMPPPSALPSR